MSSVVLVSFARTPIGSLSGSLSQLLAPKLGSAAIAGALSKIGGVNALESHNVEVILGNVVSAGVGQAPARQAAKAAGLPNSTQCTTLNKVCASGMKSAMYGASSIMLGSDNVVIAGGFESMSRIPHYMMGGRVGEVSFMMRMRATTKLTLFPSIRLARFTRLSAVPQTWQRDTH